MHCKKLSRESMCQLFFTMIHGGVGMVVGGEVWAGHAPHMVLMVIVVLLDLSVVPVPAGGPLLDRRGVQPSRVHSHHGLL